MTTIRTPKAWASSAQQRSKRLFANTHTDQQPTAVKKPTSFTINIDEPEELKPLYAQTAKAVKAGLDMSANSVDNMRCPATGEPMKIVQCYFREKDGTMTLSHVAMNPNSRIVLPLPNNVLQDLSKG